MHLQPSRKILENSCKSRTIYTVALYINCDFTGFRRAQVGIRVSKADVQKHPKYRRFVQVIFHRILRIIVRGLTSKFSDLGIRWLQSDRRGIWPNLQFWEAVSIFCEKVGFRTTRSFAEERGVADGF